MPVKCAANQITGRPVQSVRKYCSALQARKPTHNQVHPYYTDHGAVEGRIYTLSVQKLTGELSKYLDIVLEAYWRDATATSARNGRRYVHPAFYSMPYRRARRYMMPENGAENVPVNDTTSMNSDLNSYPYASSAVGSSSRMISSATEDVSDNLEREIAASDLNSAKNDIVSSDVPLSRKRQRRAMTTTTISSTTIQSARLSPPMTRSRSSSSSSQITTRTASPKKSPLRRKRATPTHSPSASDSLLRDTIPANLILLLVGVNPGTLTGKTGYAYAHPSNLFWKLLFSSGITRIRHPPSDTYKLPELYSVGNTNIVERPTRDASMLSQAEIDAGVVVLQAKVAAQRPEVVCLVGKGIWEAVWRVRHGRAIRKQEFRYGWQDQTENIGRMPDSDWVGARVFVATTTSGLAAGMSITQKEAVWAELGMWVAQRRVEKGLAVLDD